MIPLPSTLRSIPIPVPHFYRDTTPSIPTLKFPAWTNPTQSRFRLSVHNPSSHDFSPASPSRNFRTTVRRPWNFNQEIDSVPRPSSPVERLCQDENSPPSRTGAYRHKVRQPPPCRHCRPLFLELSGSITHRQRSFTHPTINPRLRLHQAITKNPTDSAAHLPLRISFPLASCHWTLSLHQNCWVGGVRHSPGESTLPDVTSANIPQVASTEFDLDWVRSGLSSRHRYSSLPAPIGLRTAVGCCSPACSAPASRIISNNSWHHSTRFCRPFPPRTNDRPLATTDRARAPQVRHTLPFIFRQVYISSSISRTVSAAFGT